MTIISGIYEICSKVDVTNTRHVRLMLVIYARHSGTKNKANKMKKIHQESTENMNVRYALEEGKKWKVW